MNTELLSAAVSVGVFHTAIGFDHYIPFVAISKSNKWNFAKTMLVVFICGIAHILTSLILALCGIMLGAQLSSLLGIQHFRGEIALWFLIVFGFIYMLWGIKNSIVNKPHEHIQSDGKKTLSFWFLFILLVLGPCELLIPLLMYSAAQGGTMSVISIAAVYSFFTIITMLFCAAVVLKGVNMLPVKKIERYSHALAGFTVFICGLAIKILSTHAH